MHMPTHIHGLVNRGAWILVKSIQFSQYVSGSESVGHHGPPETRGPPADTRMSLDQGQGDSEPPENETPEIRLCPSMAVVLVAGFMNRGVGLCSDLSYKWGPPDTKLHEFET